MAKTPEKKVHKSSATLFREILCIYMIETVGNYNWYLEVEDFHHKEDLVGPKDLENGRFPCVTDVCDSDFNSKSP